MGSFKSIHLLNRGELPGAGYYNELASALKNISSLSDCLVIDRAPDGGLTIDFDESMLDLGGSEGAASFSGNINLCPSLSNGTWYVSDGRVTFPGIALDVSGAHGTLTGSTKIWLEISSSSAALASGTSWPSYWDGTKFSVRIAYGVSSGSSLVLVVCRKGDLNFPAIPFQWVSGYSASTVQFLTHDATGALAWVTPTTCS